MVRVFAFLCYPSRPTRVFVSFLIALCHRTHRERWIRFLHHRVDHRRRCRPMNLWTSSKLSSPKLMLRSSLRYSLFAWLLFGLTPYKKSVCRSWFPNYHCIIVFPSCTSTCSFLIFTLVDFPHESAWFLVFLQNGPTTVLEQTHIHVKTCTLGMSFTWFCGNWYVPHNLIMAGIVIVLRFILGVLTEVEGKYDVIKVLTCLCSIHCPIVNVGSRFPWSNSHFISPTCWLRKYAQVEVNW